MQRWRLLTVKNPQADNTAVQITIVIVLTVQASEPNPQNSYCPILGQYIGVSSALYNDVIYTSFLYKQVLVSIIRLQFLGKLNYALL
jgi:hypothetical protein